MAPKTEDQIFLERLGVLDDTNHRDHEFEAESNEYEELEELKYQLEEKEERLSSWEQRLNRRERELDNRKRLLDDREAEINKREIEVDLREDEMWDKVPDDENPLGEPTPEEIRKKQERIKKLREAATRQSNTGYWSTNGWNT